MGDVRAKGRRPTVLCAAFSARQIAESARLSGYDVLAVDLFADLDLSAAAKRSERVAGHYPDGFADADLLAALERVSRGETPAGFVYGAGFEDRPHLLEAIGERWPILGTDPASLRRLKDPEVFAELCAKANVAHPEIARAKPGEGRWLSKQAAGCGGSHVRWACDGSEDAAAGRYLQRFVEGERWSLLFLAAHGEVRAIGFSRQWPDPCEEEPFRYGGAVGPLAPDRRSGSAMSDAMARIVGAASGDGVHVRGLASADFVVSGADVHCLEINPRFGATIDVFDSGETPLFAAHMAACRGDVMEAISEPRPRIRACGLAWAVEDTKFPKGFEWPHWARDTSRLPVSFASGEPIATVVAEGKNAEDAERLFRRRVDWLRASGNPLDDLAGV